MKTDQTIAQPLMKSQPHDEQTTPVMHRSDARQSAEHYPKRSGGSTTGNVTQEEQWAYRMGWFGIGLGLLNLWHRVDWRGESARLRDTRG